MWSSKVFASEDIMPSQHDPDFVYSLACGCRITFFGQSGYKTSRMLCCVDHGMATDAASRWRDRFRAHAKQRLQKWQGDAP